MVPAAHLDANRYVTLVDNYARSPRLYITYPTIPNFHKDMPALDCLAEILGQGKNIYTLSKFNKKSIGADCVCQSWQYRIIRRVCNYRKPFAR
jgi:zinc protease